jgi:hypothetical protein
MKPTVLLTSARARLRSTTAKICHQSLIFKHVCNSPRSMTMTAPIEPPLIRPVTLVRHSRLAGSEQKQSAPALESGPI